VAEAVPQISQAVDALHQAAQALDQAAHPEHAPNAPVPNEPNAPNAPAEPHAPAPNAPSAPEPHAPGNAPETPAGGTFQAAGTSLTQQQLDHAIGVLEAAKGIMIAQPLKPHGHPLAATDYKAYANAYNKLKGTTLAPKPAFIGYLKAVRDGSLPDNFESTVKATPGSKTKEYQAANKLVKKGDAKGQALLDELKAKGLAPKGPKATPHAPEPHAPEPHVPEAPKAPEPAPHVPEPHVPSTPPKPELQNKVPISAAQKKDLHQAIEDFQNHDNHPGDLTVGVLTALANGTVLAVKIGSDAASVGLVTKLDDGEFTTTDHHPDHKMTALQVLSWASTAAHNPTYLLAGGHSPTTALFYNSVVHTQAGAYLWKAAKFNLSPGDFVHVAGPVHPSTGAALVQRLVISHPNGSFTAFAPSGVSVSYPPGSEAAKSAAQNIASGVLQPQAISGLEKAPAVVETNVAHESGHYQVGGAHQYYPKGAEVFNDGKMFRVEGQWFLRTNNKAASAVAPVSGHALDTGIDLGTVHPAHLTPLGDTHTAAPENAFNSGSQSHDDKYVEHVTYGEIMSVPSGHTVYLKGYGNDPIPLHRDGEKLLRNDGISYSANSLAGKDMYFPNGKPDAPAAAPPAQPVATKLAGVDATQAQLKQAIKTLENAKGIMVKQPLAKIGNPFATAEYHYYAGIHKSATGKDYPKASATKLAFIDYLKTLVADENAPGPAPQPTTIPAADAAVAKSTFTLHTAMHGDVGISVPDGGKITEWGGGALAVTDKNGDLVSMHNQTSGNPFTDETLQSMQNLWHTPNAINKVGKQVFPPTEKQFVTVGDNKEVEVPSGALAYHGPAGSTIFMEDGQKVVGGFYQSGNPFPQGSIDDHNYLLGNDPSHAATWTKITPHPAPTPTGAVAAANDTPDPFASLLGHVEQANSKWSPIEHPAGVVPDAGGTYTIFGKSEALNGGDHVLTLDDSNSIYVQSADGVITGHSQFGSLEVTNNATLNQINSDSHPYLGDMTPGSEIAHGATAPGLVPKPEDGNVSYLGIGNGPEKPYAAGHVFALDPSDSHSVYTHSQYDSWWQKHTLDANGMPSAETVHEDNLPSGLVPYQGPLTENHSIWPTSGFSYQTGPGTVSKAGAYKINGMVFSLQPGDSILTGGSSHWPGKMFIHSADGKTLTTVNMDGTSTSDTHVVHNANIMNKFHPFTGPIDPAVNISPVNDSPFHGQQGFIESARTFHLANGGNFAVPSGSFIATLPGSSSIFVRRPAGSSSKWTEYPPGGGPAKAVEASQWSELDAHSLGYTGDLSNGATLSAEAEKVAEPGHSGEVTQGGLYEINGFHHYVNPGWKFVVKDQSGQGPTIGAISPDGQNLQVFFDKSQGSVNVQLKSLSDPETWKPYKGLVAPGTPIVSNDAAVASSNLPSATYDATLFVPGASGSGPPQYKDVTGLPEGSLIWSKHQTSISDTWPAIVTDGNFTPIGRINTSTGAFEAGSNPDDANTVAHDSFYGVLHSPMVEASWTNASGQTITTAVPVGSTIRKQGTSYLAYRHGVYLGRYSALSGDFRFSTQQSKDFKSNIGETGKSGEVVWSDGVPEPSPAPMQDVTYHSILGEHTVSIKAGETLWKDNNAPGGYPYLAVVGADGVPTGQIFSGNAQEDHVTGTYLTILKSSFANGDFSQIGGENPSLEAPKADVISPSMPFAAGIWALPKKEFLHVFTNGLIEKIDANGKATEISTEQAQAIKGKITYAGPLYDGKPEGEAITATVLHAGDPVPDGEYAYFGQATGNDDKKIVVSEGGTKFTRIYKDYYSSAPTSTEYNLTTAQWNVDKYGLRSLDGTTIVAPKPFKKFYFQSREFDVATAKEAMLNWTPSQSDTDLLHAAYGGYTFYGSQATADAAVAKYGSAYNMLAHYIGGPSAADRANAKFATTIEAAAASAEKPGKVLTGTPITQTTNAYEDLTLNNSTATNKAIKEIVDKAGFSGKAGKYMGHMSMAYRKAWIDAWYSGNWDQAYQLEVDAAHSQGTTVPATFHVNHPGSPGYGGATNNPGKVNYLPFDPTQIPAGTAGLKGSGQFPDSYATAIGWIQNQEALEDYLLTAKLTQYSTGLSLPQLKNLASYHAHGDQQNVDKLTALGKQRVTQGLSYTEPILPAKTLIPAGQTVPLPAGFAKFAPEANFADHLTKPEIQEYLTSIFPKSIAKGLLQANQDNVLQGLVQLHYLSGIQPNSKSYLQPAVAKQKFDALYSTIGSSVNSYGELTVAADGWGVVHDLGGTPTKVFTKLPASEQPKYGGFGEKYDVADQFGNVYLFKVAKEKFRPYTEDAAHKAGQLFGFKMAASEVRTIGNDLGQVQTKIPSTGDLKGFDPKTLTKKELEDIARIHVLDWLLDDDDAHWENFFRTPDGGVVPIDKGRAWVRFGQYKLKRGMLSQNVMGDHMKVYDPIYNAMVSGKIDQANVDAAYRAAISRARAVTKGSDDAYRAILEEGFKYRTDFSKTQFKSKAALIEAALARKNSMEADFEKFWDSIYSDAGLTKPEAPSVIAPGVHTGVTQDLLDDVKNAQRFGHSTFFSGKDFEDASIDVRNVISAKGDVVLVANGHLRKDGDTKLTALLDSLIDPNYLSQSYHSQTTPTVPTIAVLNPSQGPKESQLFTAIFEGSKTINHHSLDGQYNAQKVAALETAKADIENALKTNTETMAEQWFGGKPVLAGQYREMLDLYLSAASNALDAKEKGNKVVPHFVRYDYTPKPEAEDALPGPVVKPTAPFTVTRGKALFHLAAVPQHNMTKTDPATGFTVLGSNTLDYGASLSFSGQGRAQVEGDAYHIEFNDGTKIEYRPWNSNFGARLAHKGWFRVETVGNDATQLQQALDMFEQSGVDMTPMDSEERMELYYWRHLYGVLLDRKGSTKTAKVKAKFASLHPDQATSEAEELSRWREVWSELEGKQLVDNWVAKKGYMPTFQNFGTNAGDEYGHGIPHWDRFDIDLEALRKKLPHGLQHSLSGSIAPVAQTNALMSTEERHNTLAAHIMGQSPDDDQQKGSSDQVYTRLSTSFSSYSKVWLDPRVLAWTTSYVFQNDQYGNINYKKSGAPWEMDDIIALGHSSNEAMLKGQVSLLDYSQTVIFQTEAARQVELKRLKDAGIDTIGGVPIEDVYVTEAQAQAAHSKQVQKNKGLTP
jgi:hypothetical protein